MNDHQALQVAIREVTKNWRELKRNVMAEPRAAELREQKLVELTAAMKWLLMLQFPESAARLDTK